MLMYNLLEYSDNYSKKSENLWNYYRKEIDNFDNNVSYGKSFLSTKRDNRENTSITYTTWKSGTGRLNIATINVILKTVSNSSAKISEQPLNTS